MPQGQATAALPKKQPRKTKDTLKLSKKNTKIHLVSQCSFSPWGWKLGTSRSESQHTIRKHYVSLRTKRCLFCSLAKTRGVSQNASENIYNMFYGEFFSTGKHARSCTPKHTYTPHTRILNWLFPHSPRGLKHTGGIVRQRMAVLASMAEATPSLHCHNNSHFEYMKNRDVVLWFIGWIYCITRTMKPKWNNNETTRWWCDCSLRETRERLKNRIEHTVLAGAGLGCEPWDCAIWRRVPTKRLAAQIFCLGFDWQWWMVNWMRLISANHSFSYS